MENKPVEESAEKIIRTFQWIKGENAGVIETLKEEFQKSGKIWYKFESGNKANAELINDYFVEILDGGIPVSGEVDPLSGMKIETVSPVTESVTKPVEKIIKKISPIRELLEKQKDSTKENVKLELTVRVPNVNLFELLESSYGEEVSKEIVESIVESLNKDLLYKMVESSILKYYGKETIE